MEFKIYIVEDNPETYNGYHEKIEGLNTRYPISIVSTGDTQRITYTEFEVEIKEKQPDIIFLDYDLMWKDNRNDAPNVVQTIIKQYNKVNFPPIIILNTVQKELHQEVFNLLNFQLKRNPYPREFLLSVTPDLIQSKTEEFIEVINQCFDIVLYDRKHYQWSSGITHYKYPSIDDLIRYSISDAEFLSESQWLTPANYQEAPLVNRKNILLITAATTYGKGKKSKVGSIFYVDKQDHLQKGIFKFTDKTNIDETLYGSEKVSSLVKTQKFYFNNYFFGKNIGAFKLSFLQNEKLKTEFFVGKEAELQVSNCTANKHPFYKLLPIKE